MFGFSPGMLRMHRGATHRLLQPNMWWQAYKAAMAPDGDNGFLIGSDFKCFGLSAAVASNVGRYGDESCQYRSYEDTGDAIAQNATDRNGAITFTTAATDNNESWLQPGGAGSVSSVISTTAGDDRVLIFDCRFKIGVLAETAAFIGLSEESLAAADTLVNDTGALADKDFIGFHIPAHASVATCSFVYKKAGQTAQTVISGLKTMVADTYYRMGFVWNPQANPARRISVFLDNVEQGTYVTAANIAAETFPNQEELQPLFGIKTGAASAKTLTTDGWALYQGG